MTMLNHVPPFGLTEDEYAANIRATEDELERVGGLDTPAVPVDRGILLGLLEERLNNVMTSWELWQGDDWPSRPIEIKATASEDAPDN